MTKQIKLLLIIFLSILLVTAGCSTYSATSGSGSKDKNVITDCKYKNVIVMIPDGCSISIQTFARYYKGSDLHLDKLNTGSVRTYAANSIISDSAAAVTAFATGHKTTTGFIGVGPRANDLLTGYKPEVLPYYPVPSILEGAKYNGKSTGLVVTSVISHATPGGFASHVPQRMQYDDIMEQIVYQNIDVVFGGGVSYLLPKGETYLTKQGDKWQGLRKDSDNLLETLTERGYKFISSSDDMAQLNDEKVWGLFNDKNLVPVIDRDELNPQQPSLVEMTEKAIDILSKDEDGFFLVVEGSQIDYAAHAHDPVYMVTEFLDFDEAVGKAVDFAKKDGNTLVVIFPDHDTGGLAIGNNSKAARNYSSMSIESLLAPVKNAEITVQGLLELAYEDNHATTEEIKELFKTKWQLSLDDTQAKEILKFNRFNYAVADYISQNFTILGWTTAGHTGEDVPLWAYPCKGECTLSGNIENSEIAHKLAEMMSFDLKYMQEELFVDVGSIFPDYTLEDDETGFVLKIGENRLPVNKDIVYKGDKSFRTGGIVVNAPNINKVFIPKEAVEIIQSNK